MHVACPGKAGLASGCSHLHFELANSRSAGHCAVTSMKTRRWYNCKRLGQDEERLAHSSDDAIWQ